VNETAKQPPQTLTEMLRLRFKGLLDSVGAFLNRLGIAPNTLTLTGLAGNLVGAIFLARGNFLIGGLILLFMGPLDALDGTMARLRGEPTAFGGFIDSVTDRYSELLIYGGILLHYAMAADITMSMVTFAAASGSVLVSYTRARAQGLGYEAKGGVLTRAERFFVLIPSLILGYARVGIWLVAVFSNITAIQRILQVRRQAR